MRILGERLTPFLRYPAFEFSCKRKVFYLQDVVHNDLILPFEYSGWLGFERFVQLVTNIFYYIILVFKVAVDSVDF